MILVQQLVRWCGGRKTCFLMQLKPCSQHMRPVPDTAIDEYGIEYFVYIYINCLDFLSCCF